MQCTTSLSYCNSVCVAFFFFLIELSSWLLLDSFCQEYNIGTKRSLGYWSRQTQALVWWQLRTFVVRLTRTMVTVVAYSLSQELIDCRLLPPTQCTMSQLTMKSFLIPIISYHRHAIYNHLTALNLCFIPLFIDDSTVHFALPQNI